MAETDMCRDCGLGMCAEHGTVAKVAAQETPFVCPVCRGTRSVLAGFYGPPAMTTTQEPCRSCDGSGIVWR